MAKVAKTAAISSRTAQEFNGVRIHYLASGKGEPVVLLHGYAQNSHMWRPLIAELAKTNTVIAPDLRGFGQSAKPAGGYDKKTMAQDIHALAASLGYKRVRIAGHDIGLMVAYAYAAQYPSEVDRIALMDAFLPGVGDWTKVWLLRDLWHFHFYGETPLEARRRPRADLFRAFLERFCRRPRKSRCPSRIAAFYAEAYAQPGAMRRASRCSVPSSRTPRILQSFAKTKLTMPMLVLTGEKASGEFLIAAGPSRSPTMSKASSSKVPAIG